MRDPGVCTGLWGTAPTRQHAILLHSASKPGVCLVRLKFKVQNAWDRFMHLFQWLLGTIMRTDWPNLCFQSRKWWSRVLRQKQRQQRKPCHWENIWTFGSSDACTDSYPETCVPGVFKLGFFGCRRVAHKFLWIRYAWSGMTNSVCSICGVSWQCITRTLWWLPYYIWLHLLLFFLGTFFTYMWP